MRKKLIIGFSGIARVGKTSAANIIFDKFMDEGKNTEIMSFAGPLKYGLEIMGVTKDENPVLYRTLAQYIGTDVLRKHDTDWWTALMRKNIENSFADVIVIDDVRFPNEVSLIKDLNGINAFVAGGPRINLELPMYGHISENMSVIQEVAYREWKDTTTQHMENMIDFDMFVENHTTYDDFLERLLDKELTFPKR